MSAEGADLLVDFDSWPESADSMRTATEGDPVDVASGDVILAQADVTLPGVLPLVLQRTHRSGYRAGRWFGRTWASTLDQRLEVSEHGVFLAGEDGVVLCYPHPGEDGAPVLPVAGPCWPLASAQGGGYTVTDPQAGTVRAFAPHPGTYLSAEGFGELPLASVTSRGGHRISFGYAPDGAPQTVAHDGGYLVRAEADGGRVTSLSLAGAGADGADVTLARFGYDSAGNLAEVSNPPGEPVRLSYDDGGRLTGWQDRNGWWYRYAYDTSGRCVRAEGPDGFLSGTFSYDPERRITTHTGADGTVTTYQLTEQWQVAAVTDPLGNVTRSGHDRSGQLVSRTDPLGRRTQWTYDTAGSLTMVTRPGGQQATAAYSELNRPVLVTEPGGATWRQEFDAAGNLVRQEDPAGAVTRYAYDDRGHLAAVTGPLGATTRVQCDQAGLPVAVTGTGGAFWRCERDGFGRVAAITEPDGGITRQSWTAEGLLAARTLPDGSTERFGYDGEGHLLTHADPAGAVTRAEYGCLGQVTARTGPDGTRTEFSYDRALRLTHVVHGGLTWRYEYDPAGRLAAETDYNGAVTRYAYDAAGQLTMQVNGAGQRVSYTHDLLGNLAERRAGEAVTRYSYDPAGRLVSAEGPGAALEFERDAAGRVTAETCNGLRVRSAYDAAGRRVERVTPSGAQARWDYDEAGRPIALTAASHELRFGYDPAGRETVRELPGGVNLVQEWDQAGRLAVQALARDLAAPLQRRRYSYRADGCPVSVDDRLTGPRRISLDPAGRVTRVTGPGWAEQYGYDPAGNITGATWSLPEPSGPAAPLPEPGPGGAEQGQRQYAGTLVTRAGDVRYEHDMAGRIVLRQRARLSRKPDTWRYEWDATSRLSTVTTPDGTSWRYLYDPLGRRIAKQRLTAGGQAAEQVSFTWDGPVLAEEAVTGGETPGHVTTWDYLPGTYTPLTQHERHPLREVPQEQVDERFYAIVTDLVGTRPSWSGRTGNSAAASSRRCGAPRCGVPAAPRPRCGSPASTPTRRPACTTTTSATTTRVPAAT